MKIATQKYSAPRRAGRRLAEHADPFTVESLESRRLFSFIITHPVLLQPILLEPKISVVASAPTGLSQQFTITNTGLAPLTLTSPPTLGGFTESDPGYPSFLSPNAQSLFATYPPFSISTAPSTAPIAPGGSTTFVVTFSDGNAFRSIVFPSVNTITTAIDFGAAITIGSNDPQSPTLVDDVTASYGIVPYKSLPTWSGSGHVSKILAGNGSSTGNQDPSLPFTISENSSELSDQQFIHFGTRTAGGPAAQSALVFANNGADTLNFSLAANGSGFTASDPVTSVAPGKTAGISVIPSVNAPGAITGSVSLKVTDPAKNVTQNFTFFVDGQVTPHPSAPAFTSPNAAVFLAGSASTFNILTSGFPQTNITESGALPKGITLNTSGQLVGTPTAAGTYKFTLTAANSVASATQAFTLTVNQPTAFTSKSTATFKHGQVNSFTITTTGSQPATLSDLTPIAGITFTPAANGSALLTSSKTLAAGTYLLKFTATAPGGQPQQQLFTLTVS